MNIHQMIHDWRQSHFITFYFGKNDVQHYIDSFRHYCIRNGIEPFEDDEIRPYMQAEVSLFTIAVIPTMANNRCASGFPVVSPESAELFQQLTGQTFHIVEGD